MTIFTVLQLLDTVLVRLPNALMARQQLAAIRAQLEADAANGVPLDDSTIRAVLDQIRALNDEIQSENPDDHPE